MSFVLSDASDYYSEAIILGKAANILRRHMLNHKFKFCGTYHEGCIPGHSTHYSSVCGHAWHGADIKSQLRFGASKTDVAIAQLLQYNSHAVQRRCQLTDTPPLSHIGLSVYTQTRQRTLVDKLNEWHQYFICT